MRWQNHHRKKSHAVSSRLMAALLAEFWVSLMAQAVKNLPAIKETQIQSLGREDPLEKGMAIHSSILAWRIPQTGAWQATVHGIAKSWTLKRLSTGS